MGLFNIFRKRGKDSTNNATVQEVEEQAADRKNNFKTSVKRAVNVNLTPEQLRERLFELLAVDASLKGMPMVKEKILRELSSIELKTVEDIKKSIDEISVTKDGKFILFPNEHTLFFPTDSKGESIFIIQTEERKERDIGAMLNNSIKFATFETKTGYVYDIRTGIETFRTISTSKNGEKVSECDISRDVDKIEKVTKMYTYIHPDGTEDKEEPEEIDLTQRPGDIATLDGADANQINILYYQQKLDQQRLLESRHYLQKPSSYYNEFPKRLLEKKISESSNVKGCYEYMGISQPTVVPSK